MNLRLLDEKYVRDKKLLEDKYVSDLEVMKKVLLETLSIYVSKKYFNDIIEMKVNYIDDINCIECIKNLKRDGEKLEFGILIHIYDSEVEINIFITYTNKYGYKVDFESDFTDEEDIRETLFNDLYKSAFDDLAPILDKFITNDFYEKVGKDIYRYFRMLYDTDYLHNLPKATTFYLCTRTTFPRDIAKIIYKKILFFLIVS